MHQWIQNSFGHLTWCNRDRTIRDIGNITFCEWLNTLYTNFERCIANCCWVYDRRR